MTSDAIGDPAQPLHPTVADAAQSETPVAPASAPVVAPSFREPSRPDRYVSLGIALVLSVLFYVHARAYWVAAHPGTDQNGYLVGGKLIAQTLTMKLAPVRPGSASGAFDPFQHVGSMWVGTNYGTADEAFYPKYPIGLPLLYAISLWIGGDQLGPIIAYSISPIAMTLAVLATFLLAREFMRPAYALLAMIVFLTSPVTLGLSTNPNSHATAVFCVTWGLYLLRRWWKVGGPYRASFAGLLIGYAATIRYSEGALIGVIAFTAVLKLISRQERQDAKSAKEGQNETSAWRPWRLGALGAKKLSECGWLLLGWLIPVGGLVTYNLLTIGHLTGYDPTNESTGFRWQFFSQSWETLLRHLNTNGVAFLLPVTVIGLVWMTRRAWRDGVWLALWIMPCVAIYVSYYWAPDPAAGPVATRISYLRFFMTIVPALVIAAVWTFQQFVDYVARTHNARAGAWFTFATGVVVAAVVGVHLDNALTILEDDQGMRCRVKLAADEIVADVPSGAVVIMQEEQLAQHLQFVGDYAIYLPNQTFNHTWIHGSLLNGGDKVDEPQFLDPKRRTSLFERLKDFDQPELDDALGKMITTALDRNLRVFAVVASDGTSAILGGGGAGGAKQNDRNGKRAERAERKAANATKARGLPPALDRVLKQGALVSEVIRAWNVQIPRNEAPQAPRTRGDRANVRVFPPRAYQLLEITKNPAPPPVKPVQMPGLSQKPTTAKPKPAPAATRPSTKPTTTTKATPIAPDASTKPVTAPATTQAATVATSTTQPSTVPSTLPSTAPSTKPAS